MDTRLKKIVLTGLLVLEVAFGAAIAFADSPASAIEHADNGGYHRPIVATGSNGLKLY